MQAARPNPFAPISWADEDDHAPLVTDDRGPLPAFDHLANGQTTSAYRANRIPRLPPRPAPRNLFIVDACRRLHQRTKARYLTWQLNAMRTRMDALEAAMSEALQLAIDMAKRHKHSPALQQRRRYMRADHTALANEWLRVRQEIDNLQAPL